MLRWEGTNSPWTWLIGSGDHCNGKPECSWRVNHQLIESAVTSVFGTHSWTLSWTACFDDVLVAAGEAWGVTIVFRSDICKVYFTLSDRSCCWCICVVVFNTCCCITLSWIRAAFWLVQVLELVASRGEDDMDREVMRFCGVGGGGIVGLSDWYLLNWSLLCGIWRNSLVFVHTVTHNEK